MSVMITMTIDELINYTTFFTVIKNGLVKFIVNACIRY